MHSEASGGCAARRGQGYTASRMVARRLAPPLDTDTVTLRVDGDEVRAVRGEPIAMSLFAAGRLVLGRSVKYHRPRGAVCFSGRCDGCLLRVDGQPSVRTCREPAVDGRTLETQNVLGSAELDLLAATDWFFPGGMDHHRMFTWAKPVNQAMQLVARHVAGIGTLPETAVPVAAVEDVRVDVLVIGAGASGLSAATGCAERGLSVLCVDEEREPGGWLRFDPAARGGSSPRADELAAAALRSGVDLRCDRAVAGLFDEPRGERIALVDGRGALLRVRARAWVIAQGRTEGASAFEGSDLPGVIGAEAAARLLAHGILPGERVVIAGDLATRSAELDALASALKDAGADVTGPVGLGALVRADGRTSVTSVTLQRDGASTKHPSDLLVLGTRTGAAYELASQAGVRAEYRDGVFELAPRAQGGSVWVVGGAADARSFEEAIGQGERAALEILDALTDEPVAELEDGTEGSR